MIGRKLIEMLGLARAETAEEGGSPASYRLHRVDPLMILNIFEALKRYDSELANSLSDQLQISQERLLELASDGRLLGAGPLLTVLDALDHHPRYADIVNLAGRNCYSMQCARDGALRYSGLHTLARQVSRLLQPFLGNASLEVDVKGRVIILRITNSIFAHGRYSLNSLCGFYIGYVQQLGHDLGLRRLDACESRCACQDEDQRDCLLQISI